MQTLLDPEVRESFCRRVATLRPDTPARWGNFDAPRMLAHVIQSVGMMTGDVSVADAPTPWLMRHAPQPCSVGTWSITSVSSVCNGRRAPGEILRRRWRSGPAIGRMPNGVSGHREHRGWNAHETGSASARDSDAGRVYDDRRTVEFSCTTRRPLERRPCRVDAHGVGRHQQL